jgi:poly(3-hydroxybutyrate) depolymerase
MNRSRKASLPHVLPSLVSFAIALAPVGCSDTEVDREAKVHGGAASVGGSSGAGRSHTDASTGFGGSSSASGGTSNTSSSGGTSASGFTSWTYNGHEMGLYLPAPTGEPLPVAMFLHYCTGNPVYEEHWIISALNAVEPCAVFVPTAPPLNADCADWGGTYDDHLRPGMVDALAELDRLIQLHGFDVNREYLYGESMGGEGVYKLLAEFPERFAGGVAVAGYTVNKGASEMAKTPLWVVHSEDDNTAPYSAIATIYQSILDAGGTKVELTTYTGLDHVPALENARSDPTFLRWLLDQRRDR